MFASFINFKMRNTTKSTYWAKILKTVSIILVSCFHNITAEDVSLTVNGLSATMDNGLMNITFNSDATVHSLYKNSKNLVNKVKSRTFYLDWDGGKHRFSPTNLTVIQQSPEIAHIMYYQTASSSALKIEYNLVMLNNVSGVYQYVKASNPNNETISLAEFRTIYRFNSNLMPQITNSKRLGTTPLQNLLDTRPTIQDATWQMNDGSYYSKYDYAEYIREVPWFGVLGGGFGAWIISASREYHSGGPLKQDLLVHQDSLIANYLTGSHFGTPDHLAFPGWSKFYGPWLVYINNGTDPEVLADVDKQAQVEQTLWPYTWVEDKDYPLVRGSVFGQVTGQNKAAVVLYSSVLEPFDLQTRGYLYSTETGENGTFNLMKIRPGDYRLLAYPLAGHGSENLDERNVTVSPEYQVTATLHLPEPSGILWSIGETNRRANEFRYNDEHRNFYWQTLPPTNLTFTMGQSNIARDWYYAQTHKGIWNISYYDTPDSQPRTLRVSIAAASDTKILNETSIRLQIYANNFILGDFVYENDKAIYREALQSGNFHAEKMTVPADQVLDGENVVSLKVLGGKFMYDAVSLAMGL